MIWQLTQVLWVGGLWVLHFGLLPALAYVGLAPLLVEDVGRQVSMLLVAFAAFCGGLQALVLVQAKGLSSLWRDMRGQLLLMAMVAIVAYFALYAGVPQALRWQLFCYLVLGLTGLLLVLQPVPGRARLARH
ncbi:MFS transporter [Pseudomonas sp. LS1212]|uniref:MFS transporter n=1 Tax=Pseudomonas sp. LS1212 TaxID=2972478 RepID=UPI00215C30CE|nr:MFS transporter [Pseudomonas sp. LS1212]UVJ44729.1 MFS transporter [Pseudomonas sp. LS1212]